MLSSMLSKVAGRSRR